MSRLGDLYKAETLRKEGCLSLNEDTEKREMVNLLTCQSFASLAESCPIAKSFLSLQAKQGKPHNS